ncbi:nucleotidyltransferase domain-containing protein [Acidaminobacter sp. JC074]|uniref:nucleotidyltransferase domain-containing protein n=1 Tax=Acidaminobacter sp. JC074 TaxID=2530199 RepID=UPI001F1037C3|nr:nucleotidyltransferase domain-containing protein [Acidaminobacter sp. JC074]MCH4891265.1 nucleotidyltransferase domain-containing protein [Acidaminobacter sp. JC074]
MYTRIEAVEKIKAFVVSHQKISAAWEGGSIATGFDDELSDLDLCMVCKDPDKENVLRDLIAFLRETFGQENMYRLEEPTHHGFSQVFFKTKNTPEFFYVDFVVMSEEQEDKYIEANRHGQADIWLEKYKLDNTDRPAEKVHQVCQSLFNKTIQADFLIILELKKALHRKMFSEAFPVYYAFLTRYLIVLLNIKHRPEKADFGPRYIYRDYPEEDYLLIEKAMKVSNIEELKASSYLLLNLYDKLKKDLSTLY